MPLFATHAMVIRYSGKKAITFLRFSQNVAPILKLCLTTDGSKTGIKNVKIPAISFIMLGKFNKTIPQKIKNEIREYLNTFPAFSFPKNIKRSRIFINEKKQRTKLAKAKKLKRMLKKIFLLFKSSSS